ncbi:type II toxin-antitoxin system HicB family antitoxin [Levilactobacillus mulengensis]|uniref:type II toxin-antitoxin system HicB family antitoxin n=1 Tax=Levilactobacillus mulengensis TaxID=2486025 RepID=UPI000F771CD7|nr:type II toxin-antitoxin system HicB family antitoxin [Levilactobacillus mulengensis]
MPSQLIYPLIAQENNDEDGQYYVGYSPNIPGMVTQTDSLVKLPLAANDAIATMLEGSNGIYPTVQDPRTWNLQSNETVIYVRVDPFD